MRDPGNEVVNLLHLLTTLFPFLNELTGIDRISVQKINRSTDTFYERFLRLAHR